MNEFYTEKDSVKAEELTDSIRQRNLTQSAIAKAAGMPAATLNLVLSGKYGAPPDAALGKIAGALQMIPLSNAQTPPKFVETNLLKLIRRGGNKARKDKVISVITSAVGTGKTTGIKNAWMFDKGIIFRIEADPVMSVDVFIDELTRQLGIEVRGTMSAKFARIIEKLKGSMALIIIDEAETLKPKVLETARRIKDKAEIGMMLIGTEKLRTMLEPQQGHFGQIRSRATFWPCHVDKIGEADEDLLINTYLPDLDDQTKDKITAIAKGSARMLCEGLLKNLRNWQKSNPDQSIDRHIVEAIADQAMSLS